MRVQGCRVQGLGFRAALGLCGDNRKENETYDNGL